MKIIARYKRTFLVLYLAENKIIVKQKFLTVFDVVSELVHLILAFGTTLNLIVCLVVVLPLTLFVSHLYSNVFQLQYKNSLYLLNRHCVVRSLL